MKVELVVQVAIPVNGKTMLRIRVIYALQVNIQMTEMLVRNRGPISCQAFAPFAFPICDIVVINKKLKMPIANEVVAETAA